jgi:hypothetical protein
MKARCRISTRVRHEQNAPTRPPAHSARPTLRFLTDSKQLSSFLRPYFQGLFHSISTFLEIGVERAFRIMSTNLNVFHLEAARREL